MFELGHFAEPLHPALPQHVQIGGATFDVESVNSAAPGKDQDALLIVDGFAGVADGATPLSGDGKDVAQFALDALNAISVHKNLPCEQMYRRAVESVTRQAQLSSSETPSCTIAVARAIGANIELSSLCDSFAVAKLVDGTYVVVQNNAPPIDALLNQYMGQMLGQGMTFDAARAEIVKILRAERPRLMNQPGGYWVFANDPSVGEHAVTQSIPADQIEAILLATDGFGRVFDLFGAVRGPEALLDLAKRDGLPEVQRLLRRLELMPGSMRRRPRPSVQDDATAILLTRTQLPRQRGAH